MPTELGDPFDITWRGDPQQMLAADTPLWHLFLDKYAKDFQRFYYNVKIGGADLTNFNATPEMKKMYYQATAKRIDALGEKTDEIWIIEVASSPGLRAAGQILSYSFLWRRDPKIPKKEVDVLVCYNIDIDLRAVLEHHGVRIITMEAPKTPNP